MLKIIETPRDGIQGITSFIPTKQKVEYINSLLRVGFDTVEVGSFVSSKAIPQLKDTAEVLKKIDLSTSHSKIMVLIPNLEGARKAINFDAVDSLLFPFSISESFLKRNINKNLNDGFDLLMEILEVAVRSGKELIAYLTMGFGNPYNDEWTLEILTYWVERLYDLGLRTIPLSDITGESTTEIITLVYKHLIKKYPKVEFGFHLHAHKHDSLLKIDAAYRAGCRRFDTVLGGIGGCPMTGKELLTNLDTNFLLDYFKTRNVLPEMNLDELYKATKLANNFKKFY